ncbi:phosphate carrier protein, mitochondrial isoform X2 [Lates japonicus]|uniref:Solute carrier family 25 member 3 n=1 Tax=Lates japonicus TaxID=270547 RepID=A0AAD3N6S9_LATJO|nr:phosphate carrier protein, mitochondrial isoform X2 [Lates japonicus]
MFLSRFVIHTSRLRLPDYHTHADRDPASRQDTTMYPTSLTQLARGNPFSAPLFTLQKVEEPQQSLHGQRTRRLAAAATADEGDSCEFGSQKYFVLCGFGGILSCGTTHTAVVPLDLVKCRMQVNPDKYKSIGNGFSVTVREDGVRGLAKGWAPTFIGYSMQGLCKFGFYEVFKILYSDILGEENTYLWRTSLYLAASASAEFFADIALAPMEAVKVRIQTQPGYANTLRQCVPKMFAEEGLWANRFLITRSLDPPLEGAVLLSRAPQQLSGCTVGGVWKGLVARIIMIGTLTALQWFIYDSVKVYFRLPRPPPPEMPESLKKKLGLTE